MTKSLRWGVGSLMALAGLVAVTSFVGCSDDEPGPGPVDTDTGTAETSTDTGTDTGTPPVDSATDSGGDTDAAVPPPDRAVTIVHASPDYGAKFFCLGAFTADPATQDKPVQALGPIGKPDATAPTDPTKFTALAYGSVVPLPLTPTAVAALKAFTVAIWTVDKNPLTEATPRKCEDTWAETKAKTDNWLKVDKNAVDVGQSGLIALKGCLAASTATTPECGPDGAAKSFKWELHKLDTVKPTAFAGGGTGAKTGIQFLHLSKFASFDTTAGLDFYLQGYGSVTPTGDAGTDGGDAATDAGGDGGTTTGPLGTPVLIASGAKYNDLAPKSVGVQLAGDLTLSQLHAVPKGTPSANVVGCIALAAAGKTAAEGACAGIPLKNFLAGYAAVGGGFKDGQNQFLIPFGAPVPKVSGDPTSVTLRIAFGRADF